MNKKAYNPKTGNGWKYIKGKWIFHEKGKVAKDQNPGMTKLRKLLIDDTISMPVEGAKNLLTIGKEVTAPLRSGFKTIVDKSTSDPKSYEEFGEVLSNFEANKRRKLALQHAKFTASQNAAQNFFLSESDSAKAKNKAMAQDLTVASSDDTKMAVPDYDISAKEKLLRTLPGGFNVGDVALSGDNKVNLGTNIGSGEELKPTSSKGAEPLKIVQPEKALPKYEDVIKMKRGKERDELTLAHWEKKGYNFKGVSKWDRRELANELRIGHAPEFSGSAGTYVHWGNKTFKKNGG